MNIKISMRHISNGTLPFDYQYFKASMINSKLSAGNKELAEKVHNSNDYACLVTSNIIPYDCIITKNGLNFKNGYFTISSLNPEVLEYILDGMFNDPVFKLGKEKFIVTSIEKIEPKKLESPCRFRTTSPVSVNVQKMKENGKLVKWKLYPENPRFKTQIENNLVKRYKFQYNKPPSSTNFNITNIHNVKKKAIKIGTGLKAVYSRCSMFTFDVESSVDLLQFALEMGIGENQNMGFGCIDYVCNINKKEISI